MRFAIISDIHANAAALRAVLTDAQDCGVERVVCLGDVLGYGPEAVETLELVYKRVHVCLAGNHDDAICGRCSMEDFTDFAAAAAKKQRELLTEKAMTWLKSLPYVWARGEVACAHGSFAYPELFRYITSPDEAMPSWEARTEKLLFVGHTHDPGIFVIGASGTPHQLPPSDFQLEGGKRYIVNVGSVGYPRSGSCRSSYVIWDERTRVVTFRTLPFDLDGYREKMNGRGLEEAPWIVRRQQERARPDLREEVKFGVRERKREKKVVAMRASKESAPVTPSAPPESSARLPADAAPRRSRGAWLALSAVVLLAALAAWSLASRSRRGTVETAPAAAPASASTLDAFTPFVAGWSYAVEVPLEQRLEARPGKGEAFVVMVNAKRHATRLRKTVELEPGVDKVAFQFKTMPKNKGNVVIRLYFADAQGRVLDERLESAKVSKKLTLSVPDGATTAVAQLEFAFADTLEIQLPQFSVVANRSGGNKDKEEK